MKIGQPMILLNESICFYNMCGSDCGWQYSETDSNADLCNTDFNKIKSLGNSFLLSLTDRNVYNSAQQEVQP